jgi:hypothetical protein
MAEMERLKADEKMYKAFATVQAKTKSALQKALDSLNEIERKCDEEIMDTT